MTSAGPLIVPAGLLAQLRFDPVLLIYAILLIALIVAGCVAVVRVRRWRSVDEAPASVEDQLRDYQALVERGEMDPQEFERIKAHLLQKVSEPPQEGDEMTR